MVVLGPWATAHHPPRRDRWWLPPRRGTQVTKSGGAFFCSTPIMTHPPSTPCLCSTPRRCLIKWLEVRKVCPLCNMPVLQLAQLHSKQDPGPPQGPLPGAENIV